MKNLFKFRGVQATRTSEIIFWIWIALAFILYTVATLYSLLSR